MENFLKEFGAFKQFAQKEQISIDGAETVNLFAIYRKDERSNDIMANKNSSLRMNGDQPATDKQKAYIRNIYEQNGIEHKVDDLQKLTKRQASEIIESLKN